MKMIETSSANLQLLRLMTFLSPAFPIGAYSYSHGLEQLVHDGFVTSYAEVKDWLLCLLQKGSLRNDAIFLSQSWQVMQKGQESEHQLAELAELACAMAGSYEREMESCMQGEAFLQALAYYDLVLSFPGEQLPYPIAVGAITAQMAFALDAVVTAYLHAVIVNLIQAALRLIPLGQKAGVNLLHILENDILRLSHYSPNYRLSDLGSAAILSDFSSMRHETLEIRLFCS